MANFMTDKGVKQGDFNARAAVNQQAAQQMSTNRPNFPVNVPSAPFVRAAQVSSGLGGGGGGRSQASSPTLGSPTTTFSTPNPESVARNNPDLGMSKMDAGAMPAVQPAKDLQAIINEDAVKRSAEVGVTRVSAMPFYSGNISGSGDMLQITAPIGTNTATLGVEGAIARAEAQNKANTAVNNLNWDKIMAADTIAPKSSPSFSRMVEIRKQLEASIGFPISTSQALAIWEDRKSELNKPAQTIYTIKDTSPSGQETFTQMMPGWTPPYPSLLDKQQNNPFISEMKRNQPIFGRETIIPTFTPPTGFNPIKIGVYANQPRSDAPFTEAIGYTLGVIAMAPAIPEIAVAAGVSTTAAAATFGLGTVGGTVAAAVSPLGIELGGLAGTQAINFGVDTIRTVGKTVGLNPPTSSVLIEDVNPIINSLIPSAVKDFGRAISPNNINPYKELVAPPVLTASQEKAMGFDMSIQPEAVNKQRPTPISLGDLSPIALNLGLLFVGGKTLGKVASTAVEPPNINIEASLLGDVKTVNGADIIVAESIGMKAEIHGLFGVKTVQIGDSVIDDIAGMSISKSKPIVLAGKEILSKTTILGNVEQQIADDVSDFTAFASKGFTTTQSTITPSFLIN